MSSTASLANLDADVAGRQADIIKVLRYYALQLDALSSLKAGFVSEIKDTTPNEPLGVFGILDRNATIEIEDYLVDEEKAYYHHHPSTANGDLEPTALQAALNDIGWLRVTQWDLALVEEEIAVFQEQGVRLQELFLETVIYLKERKAWEAKGETWNLTYDQWSMWRPKIEIMDPLEWRRERDERLQWEE